jgi:flagellar motor switch protein FliN
MGDLANFDIRGYISGSVAETFSTMLSVEVQPADEDTPVARGVNRMVGTLNFAGAVTGIFNIQVTVDFGRDMAANMLGMEPEEVDPASEVRDLVAELTNIVGGNLKSALNDAGYPCVLSTPSITYGTDFSIRSLSMDRFERFVFQQSGNLLIVEVGLKTVEGMDSSLDFSTPEAMSRLPNVDVKKLESLDYRTRIQDAAVDVFDTMLSLELTVAETVSASSLSGLRNVSSVCFAGDATGIVSIHVGDALVREMAAGMLGMEPDEIEGEAEIQDLMGELSNIVGGNIKSALTDAGLRCALSTPSCTSGSDFMIESMNLERYERYAFACQGQTLFIEIGVKISDLVKAAVKAGKGIHYKVAEAGSEAAEARERPRPAPPPPPAEKTKDAPPAPEDLDLELLRDIPLELTVELGRARMPIRELLQLAPGAAFKLTRLDGEPVDILANDVLIARGEVIVRNEKYGIRITEITGRMERIKGLR